MKTELTQARLKELLDYNHDTGVFTWKKPRRGVSVGNIAGHVNNRRYVKIMVDHVEYLAHRLSFLYMTGIIPEEIDHINRDGTDNRWLNLREASRTTNARNKGRRKNNKSGVTGVFKDKSSWRAFIKVNLKKIYLYYGNCKHDAIIARYKAEVELRWHESNSDTDAKRYVESLEQK